MKVLVTGGAGYIGSHTCIELIEQGHEIFVIDNLCNGHIEAIEHVQKISKSKFSFSKTDVRNKKELSSIFEAFNPEAVIHFAGLKAVGESVINPLRYFNYNVNGAISLLEVMSDYNCNNLVFSSSATVYGDPKYLPYDELHPTNPVNPYGRSKLFIEEILKDWTGTNQNYHATVLRYFNPVGAHETGLIGEDPLGTPNNLMPYISQVAIGRRDHLEIFGNDYNTPDGTGLRDYIHVVDLARAHLASIDNFKKLDPFEIINIGSGAGVTVLQLVNSFKKISGKDIPIKYVSRRQGDLDSCWADPSYALDRLGWKSKFSIEEMCRDTWRWQSKNPYGYKKP